MSSALPVDVGLSLLGPLVDVIATPVKGAGLTKERKMNFVEIFTASYRECVLNNAELFFQRFRINLNELDLNSDVGPSACEAAVLEQSVRALAEFAVVPTGSDQLRHCAARLGSIGVSPPLYDRLQQALLLSLMQVDPNFRPEDALAWRVMLAGGLEYMRSCED